MSDGTTSSSASSALANWEDLLRTPTTLIRRQGRFLVADLRVPHRVFTTSVRNGGQVDHLRYLVNHQSCEGTAHHDRHAEITAHGQEGYHDIVCAEIGLPPHDTALMSTAANMHYAAIVTERDEDVSVTAIVTAGVRSNATCAGDPANWRETRAGMSKVAPAIADASTAAASSAPASHAAAGTAETNGGAVSGVTTQAAAETSAAVAAPSTAGTINTIVLIDRPLTTAALTRAILTMAEGKSAALQRLAVPSCQSIDLATGTGTDQFCIAAPILDESASAQDTDRNEPATAASSASPNESRAGKVSSDAARSDNDDARLARRGPALTSTSPHMKLGEIIGLAVRRATMEALRWQNGLEPSYTRGLFHALSRYGVKEATIFDDLASLAEREPALLSASDLELLKKNKEAAFYEPLAGAAAHAMAAVLDRARHGTLPPSATREALVQQAALLASSLAARPDQQSAYRAKLLSLVPVTDAASLLEPTEVKRLVLTAIAVGWSAKWRSN